MRSRRLFLEFVDGLGLKLKWVGQILLSFYKVHISAHLWSSCRFEPTCSQYAKDCLHNHSFLRATGLILRRLAKCHPFGSFTYDPAPPPISRGEV